MRKNLLLLSPLVLVGSVVLEAAHTIAAQAWPGYTRQANWIDIVLQPVWLAAIIVSILQLRDKRPSLGSIGLMMAASFLSFSHGIAVRGGESSGSSTYSGAVFMVLGLLSLAGVIGYLKAGGPFRAKPIAEEEEGSKLGSRAA